MGHPDQHLVGTVQHGLRGRDGSAALTCHGSEHQQEPDGYRQAKACARHCIVLKDNDSPSTPLRAGIHTAPAFMRSCRCTIPTTLWSPSSTGRAMIPWRSIRLTAALASSSGVE